MLKTSVISIGNELLTGRSIDTNSTYINTRLFEMGLQCSGVHVVGDDKTNIVNSLTAACYDSDIILLTGGLGPTDDDITRHALAEFLSCELQIDKDLLDDIKTFFKKRGRQPSEKNKIQAYLPEKSSPMKNSIGTAAGIRAELKGKLIFAFPGVPDEMKQMFHKFALPEIEKLTENSQSRTHIFVKRLKCCGTGESNVAEKLGDLMRRTREPQVNCTVSAGIITIEIISRADSAEKAQQMCEKDVEFIKKAIGDLVFSDNDRSLAEIIGDKLKKNHQTVTFAESCTGGLVAKMLTDIPGSSEYFSQSWVTYSNKVKTELLDVPEKLLREYGAVSEETAETMAKSAKKKAPADFAIAITGIAGPTGGSEHKPVGLVYISIAGGDFVNTQRFIFSGSRDTIRKRTANSALNLLRRFLLD